MRAMADLAGDDGPVATAKIAVELGRKPASLSPARDGLIKKGADLFGRTWNPSDSRSRTSADTCADKRSERARNRVGSGGGAQSQSTGVGSSNWPR